MWKIIFKPFRLVNREKGQSIIILVFSFIGLIALLGLGIDSGMVYIEKTKLGRAVDAAALSGVTELSNEEQAEIRAIEYLGLNTYNLNDSNVYVRGCVSDIHNWFDQAGNFCGSEGCGNDNDPNQLVNVPYGMSNTNWWYPYKITDPNDDNVTNVFWLDTYQYQSDHNTACDNTLKILGDANKIAITGTVKVDMNFFQLLGRPFVPVTYHAVAQNLDSIDAVVVLDRSGSMEFDPVCYGCWERKDRLYAAGDDPDYAHPNTGDPDYKPNPGNPLLNIYDSRTWYYDYPANGVIYPLGLSEGFSNINRVIACTTPNYDADQDLPTPQNLYTFDYADTAYTDNNNFHYSIIEAELYSLNPNPADPELQASGKGYWAMQRGEANYDPDEDIPYYASSGTSIDERGAHMATHPSLLTSQDAIYGKHYSIVDAQTGNSPWLEYDFRLYPQAGWTVGSTAYIWMRVHGAGGLDIDPNDEPHDWRDWQYDQAYWALTTVSDPFVSQSPPTSGIQLITDHSGDPVCDYGNDSGCDSVWTWLQVGSFSITEDNYRLYIFAGSAGYSIDRIVITDNPSNVGDNDDGRALNPPGSFDARTANVTAASAYRAACDICNVAYGANITDLNQCTFYNSHNLKLINKPTDFRVDPLFDEWEMPLRKAKEAIKFFITRLDPKRDQVGFVYYSSAGTAKTELACKRAAATQPNINCTTGSNPISYTNVLKGVEDTRADGGTPTFRGLKAGLEVLGFQVISGDPSNFDTLCDGTSNSSCSRGGGAQRVLILLTDGNPNSTSWADGTGGDYAGAPPAPGCYSNTAPTWPADNTPAYRCPLQYAQMAAAAGITVYPIGLGFGVDRNWLKEVARLGNGQAYFSASGGDLNIIFSQILSNIYVRLIQ